VGEWWEGKRDREGTHTYANGAIFKGSTVKSVVYLRVGCHSGDCENGYGTYTFQNGNVYVGYWKKGKRDGEGICIFNNRSNLTIQLTDELGDKLALFGHKVYEGEWKKDKKNGQGKMTYNGLHPRTEEGRWKKDKYKGK